MCVCVCVWYVPVLLWLPGRARGAACVGAWRGPDTEKETAGMYGMCPGEHCTSESRITSSPTVWAMWKELTLRYSNASFSYWQSPRPNETTFPCRSSWTLLIHSHQQSSRNHLTSASPWGERFLSWCDLSQVRVELCGVKWLESGLWRFAQVVVRQTGQLCGQWSSFPWRG